MENNILKHRLAVQQNIQKSFNSDFESFDDIEKGKWNIGDTKVYQGITYEVGGFNAKGVPLWRKAKGGTSGGKTNSGSSAKTSNTSQSAQNSSVSTNEYSPEHPNIHENPWLMTNSELIKEYKIPRVIVNKHKRTIRGYKTWDDGEFSSHSKEFLDYFRRMVEKYDHPIDIKRKKFSSKDQGSHNHSRRNGEEYDWIDGEKIEISFKDDKDNVVVINNIDIL